jgi:hypothetical protein
MLENIELLLSHLKAEVAVFEARLKTAVSTAKQEIQKAQNPAAPPATPVTQDNTPKAAA